MGRRTLLELLHIIAGVLTTGLFATLAAWSVPNAADSIWVVAWVAVAVVIFMGIAPLRKAWDADRGRETDDAGN